MHSLLDNIGNNNADFTAQQHNAHNVHNAAAWLYFFPQGVHVRGHHSTMGMTGYHNRTATRLIITAQTLHQR